MSRAIVARAPTRLDFGGGWTDVAPYADEEGGAVCNVAITRFATATVASRSAPTGADASDPAGVDPLVRAALARAGVSGARAHVTSDFPVGAGLGGSSAAGVALAGALAALCDVSLSPEQLAERSRHTEMEDLGVAGGFQDHYAAALGGALLLTYDGRVSAERLVLDPGFAAAIARRVILLYTGQSRISSHTITAVADRWRDRNPQVCGALHRMKALAVEMAAALRSADLDALGAMIAEHWTHQRSLHTGITTPRIDAIADEARRAGALGIKALGASGGGCVIVVARDGDEEQLARQLAPLGERLPFSVDERGFETVAVLEEEHGDAGRGSAA